MLLASSLSILILALPRTSSFLTRSIRDTPTKLLKDFISRTLNILSQHYSTTNQPAPNNVTGTITPSYWHIHIYPTSSIARHTFQHSPRFLPLILSAYHIHFTPAIRCHVRLQVQKQSTSSDGTPFNLSWGIIHNHSSNYSIRYCSDALLTEK